MQENKDSLPTTTAIFSLTSSAGSEYIEYSFQTLGEHGDLYEIQNLLRKYIPGFYKRADDIQLVAVNGKDMSNIDLLEQLSFIEAEMEMEMPSGGGYER